MFPGCSDTDFPLQLSADGPFSKGAFADRYKLFCVDPRGYGQSRPPDRDYPLNFYDRDAEDLATAMQVSYSTLFVALLHSCLTNCLDFTITVVCTHLLSIRRE